MHRRLWPAAVSLTALLVAASCGDPPGPSGVPGAPTAASAVSQSAAVAEPLDPEIARIVAFRRSLGLRHDVEYVLALQDDPSARIDLLDFPMTLAEERELLARQAETDRVVGIVQAYAADHEDTFGGLYIDRDEMPGAVVAMFTDALLAHEVALRTKLGTAFVVLRQVRYSEAYLRSLQEVIAHDNDWMAEIPAHMDGVGTDIKENVVTLDVSSAEPDAEERIAAYYDMGDALRVVSDGTGQELIPWGWVVGTVLLPNGEPVTGQIPFLTLDGESEDTELGECGGGDMGFGVADDGTFRYPCQAGTRTIIVRAEDPDGGTREVGRVVVEVVADEETEVTIQLDEVP